MMRRIQLKVVKSHERVRAEMQMYYCEKNGLTTRFIILRKLGKDARKPPAGSRDRFGYRRTVLTLADETTSALQYLLRDVPQLWHEVNHE